MILDIILTIVICVYIIKLQMQEKHICRLIISMYEQLESLEKQNELLSNIYNSQLRELQEKYKVKGGVE